MLVVIGMASDALASPVPTNFGLFNNGLEKNRARGALNWCMRERGALDFGAVASFP